MRCRITGVLVGGGAVDHDDADAGYPCGFEENIVIVAGQTGFSEGIERLKIITAQGFGNGGTDLAAAAVIQFEFNVGAVRGGIVGAEGGAVFAVSHQVLDHEALAA